MSGSGAISQFVQERHLVQVLRETDPSTVTEHGLYERPVAKMPDEVISAPYVWTTVAHCHQTLTLIQLFSQGPPLILYKHLLGKG